MNDEITMKRLNELWNNGYADELAYFGAKCVEACLQGQRDGVRAGRLIGFACGTILSIAATIITVKVIKHRKNENAHKNEP